MSRLLRLFGLLILGLALVVPTSTAGDKDKKDDKKEVTKDEKKDDKKDEKKDDKKDEKKDDEKKVEKKAKEKFVYGSTFKGKVKSLDANSPRDFTVEWITKVPNPDGQRRLTDLNRQLQQQTINFQREKNLQQRQNIAQQIAQTKADIFKVQQKDLYKDQGKDVQLRAAENIKVVTSSPPIDYDEKGNLRKYTQAELTKMRNPYLTGYTSEWDVVRKGQWVEVYLAKTATAPAKGTKGKKDDLDDVGAQARQEVVGLVILAEPQQGK
jgi:hypothetical protein